MNWIEKSCQIGEQKIIDYFSMENRVAEYIYDFGDNWRHRVELEEILPREKGVDYPRCIDGRRACPTEDCGGVWGYENFLEIINNPAHEEYEERLNWVGGKFDPEYFNIKDVTFDDPDERWKRIKRICG